MNQINEVSLKEKASYYVYFLGQNMAYFIVSMYAMLYFTDEIGISASVIGLLFLVARIWDAVNDIMFGAIVDKSNFKGGKYKPWLNFASIILPVITAVMFMIPDISMAGKITYASVTYILWGMAYTISDVPGFSISTAMTKNTNERNSMLSLSRLFAMVGLLVVSTILMPLINAMGWTQAAIVIAFVSFILMNFQRFFVKENHKVESQGITFKQIIKCVAGNKYLLIFYVALTAMMSFSTVAIAMSYFAIYNLGSSNYIGILMMLMILPTLLVSLVVPSLVKKFGKNKLAMSSGIISFIILVAFYFIGYSNVTLVFILLALNGFCSGVINILYPMYTADCIEYGTWKNGDRTTGVAFSMQTFTTKLGQAIAGGLGGVLLTTFGYIPNVEQSERTLNGIFSMMTLIPAIGMLLFVIIFGLFYKLNESDIEMYMKENQLKENAANNN